MIVFIYAIEGGNEAYQSSKAYRQKLAPNQSKHGRGVILDLNGRPCSP